MVIWADRARRLEPQPGTGVAEELMLSKFAAVELDKDGNPTVEATSSAARLWILPGVSDAPASDASPEGDVSSRVVMRLENVVAIQQGRASGGFRERVDLAWNVPSAFRDNPKFLTFGELYSLMDDPTRINWVENRRRELALTLAERQSVEGIQKRARDEGRVVLTDDRGRPVTIFASLVTWEGDRWKLSPPAGQRVRIELSRLATAPDGSERNVGTVITAPFVTLVNDLSDASIARRLDFTLEALEATTREEGDSATTQRERVSLYPLSLRSQQTDDLLSKDVPALMDAAKRYTERPAPDPLVVRAVEQLERQLRRLSRDVLSKQHERWAMAASALVMVLTGAVTALGMSKKQPLTVYLWTFVPALICIVTISGGQQTVVQAGPIGLALLWSGVVAMALYTLMVYRRLSLH
jgi:hypothetical protein